jgi:hypothetical protein
MRTFLLSEYHTGERNAGGTLMLLGVASAALSGWVVRSGGSLTAMAWPLGLGALLELSVGAGMALGAHRELAQQSTDKSRSMAALPSTLAAQVKNYGIATRVELGLIVLAALLCLTLPRPSTAEAVLLGILVDG